MCRIRPVEYHCECVHYSSYHVIYSHTQNFVFSVKFDLTNQYDWITAAAFAMTFDLVALSAVRIFMFWVFPQAALVIMLFVLTIGSVLFGTFCGGDITADGVLVLLTCSIKRI